MHIEVDDRGVTRNVAGKPANANVCFDPQTERFFNLVIQRIDFAESAAAGCMHFGTQACVT